MRRLAVFLTRVLPLSIIVGCGGGGVEVGAPSEAPKGGMPPEFREAMQKAGSKMMKKQRPKEFGAPKKDS